MKFRTYRNRGLSYYGGNVNKYLDAIYRANKKKIDEALSNIPGVDRQPSVSPKTNFKRMVRENMRDRGDTVRAALARTGRQYEFSTRAENYREYAVQGLKSFNKYQEFKELAGIKRFNPNKLVYDKENKSYVYDGRVSISFKNSPLEIRVVRLNG